MAKVSGQIKSSCPSCHSRNTCSSSLLEFYFFLVQDICTQINRLILLILLLTEMKICPVLLQKFQIKWQLSDQAIKQPIASPGSEAVDVWCAAVLGFFEATVCLWHDKVTHPHLSFRKPAHLTRCHQFHAGEYVPSILAIGFVLILFSLFL